jgi:hypothetical protein
MMAGDAEPADCLAMLLRCVSDVGLPAIARIARGKPTHNSIARDFGDDGRGGDREAERVAFDHGLNRTRERRSNAAVDERDIWPHSEHRHSPRHRQQSRAQYVEAIYFDCARRADPDAGGPAINAPTERAVAGLALFSGQHLRIVKLAAKHLGEPAGIENHRSGDHWPSQGSSPCLIDTTHQPLTLPLNREIRHPLFTPHHDLCHAAEQFGKGTAPLGGVARDRQIAMLTACCYLRCR